MKKLVLVSILSALALSSFALDATVVSVKGKADVQKGTAWTPLAAGAKLEKGSMIQTGFKSELILNIASEKQDTTVTVAPLSRLTLEQLATNSETDKTSLYLDTGSIKSDVKKTEGQKVNFTVRSPVATASVRGTVLSVTNRVRSTDVRTHEGKVAVWKSKGKGPKVSTDAEDAAVAAPAGTGNAAADIAAEAPRGSFVVSKGQSAGFSATGAVATTREKAQKAAVAMASSTQSAAATETVSMAGSAPAAAPVIVPAPVETAPVVKKTGNLTVNVEFN